MRKILLILDGIVAENFLDTLVHKHLDKNQYIFISPNAEILKKISPSVLKDNPSYCFDPTSTYKLQEILSQRVTDAFVIIPKINDCLAIYKILRNFKQNLPIICLNSQESLKKFSNFNDPYLITINQDFILANKLLEYVPNIPKIARYVGLEQGEIMQVNVPFGSAYAYRSVGSIKQKKWKISGIYRFNELILPKYNTTILPNDSLLLVGDPITLNEIYHRIKDELGQFPTPFGRDVALYLDCKLESDIEILSDIEQCFWMFSKFKHKRLHITLLNINNFSLLNAVRNNPKLEHYRAKLTLEFEQTNLYKVIERDKKNKNLGLILLPQNSFKKLNHKIFKLGIPLLKLCETSKLQDAQNVLFVIPKATEESENISSVLFDVSKQLGLKVFLYDFDLDSNFNSKAETYFENVAQIFESKFTLETSSINNPIFWVLEHQNSIQLLTFNKESWSKKDSFWFLSTQTNTWSYKILSNPQLFIPV